MATSKIFETVVDVFVNRIHSVLDDGMTESQVAKALGVSQTSVNHWKNRRRIEGIKLQSILGFYETLGGDMADLLEAVLGSEDAALFLNTYREQPELVKKVLQILSHPDSAKARKLKAELDFLTADE